MVGSEVLLIYKFAQTYGYNINLKEAQSIQEQVDCLKNRSCNLAGCLFPILDEYRNDITYSRVFHPATSRMMVRNENSVNGSKAKTIYNSLNDFNGKTLGSLIDSYYVNLTNSTFPKSKIIPIESFYDIYTALLFREIEGCLLDKPFVDYFVNRYPKSVTAYSDVFDLNNYGFGFQKNSEGEKLMKEFNEFLAKTDTDALYNKWTTNTFL